MKKNAFSMLELLTVVAIISILISMVASFVHAVRRQSYIATAMTETRQIAQAIKAHWIAYNSFPGNWPTGSTVPLTKDVAEKLNLETSAFNFQTGGDEDDAMLDPWGRPYLITIPDPKTIEEMEPETYQTTVHFMNTEMFYHHAY